MLLNRRRRQSIAKPHCLQPFGKANVRRFGDRKTGGASCADQRQRRGADALRGELNAILGLVEQLNEVDVSGVEPMTSVLPMAMKKRADVVTDGGKADDVLANAPAREGSYFLVPKVVE